jgi:hypothetical protein
MNRRRWNNLLGILATAGMLLHAALAVGAGGVCLCGIADGRQKGVAEARGGGSCGGCCRSDDASSQVSPICPCRGGDSSPCSASSCPCQIGLPQAATELAPTTPVLLPPLGALNGLDSSDWLPDADGWKEAARPSILVNHSAPLHALLCVWRN